MPVRNDQVFPRSVRYAVGASPTTGPFSIPFPIEDDDQVLVSVGGAEVYDFVIDKADLYGTEGNTLSLETPVVQTSVVIQSITSRRRNTAESFTNSELSKEIDRLYSIEQETGEEMARSVKLPVATPGGTEIEPPQADRVLIGRPDGMGWQNGPTVAELLGGGGNIRGTNIILESGAYDGMTLEEAFLALGDPAADFTFQYVTSRDAEA